MIPATGEETNTFSLAQVGHDEIKLHHVSSNFTFGYQEHGGLMSCLQAPSAATSFVTAAGSFCLAASLGFITPFLQQPYAQFLGLEDALPAEALSLQA